MRKIILLAGLVGMQSLWLLSPVIALESGLAKSGRSIPDVAQVQEPVSQNPTLRQVRSQQRRWYRQRLRQNYRYTLEVSCFCTAEVRQPVVIEVRHGVATSITSEATGQPVNPSYFERYNTIPKLFGLVQDAIRQNASSINTQFDQRMGYPTQINIDYSAMMADEEVYLTIRDVQPLE